MRPDMITGPIDRKWRCWNSSATGTADACPFRLAATAIESANARARVRSINPPVQHWGVVERYDFNCADLAELGAGSTEHVSRSSRQLELRAGAADMLPAPRSSSLWLVPCPRFSGHEPENHARGCCTAKRTHQEGRHRIWCSGDRRPSGVADTDYRLGVASIAGAKLCRRGRPHHSTSGGRRP